MGDDLTLTGSNGSMMILAAPSTFVLTNSKGLYYRGHLRRHVDNDIDVTVKAR